MTESSSIPSDHGRPRVPTEHDRFVANNVNRLQNDQEIPQLSLNWMLAAGAVGNYSYNFSWLSRPIIQYPQDIVALQELVWAIRPTVIIETGVAHGGTTILGASLLALLDLEEASLKGSPYDMSMSSRRVISVDIEIREHNRLAISQHPFSPLVTLIQGSSIDPHVVRRVKENVQEHDTVMVWLDSNHTRDHVLQELLNLGVMTSPGSYCVVFDTVIEDSPLSLFENRPWHPGNSPMNAVDDFLLSHSDFELDTSIDAKLQITVARRGFLRRGSVGEQRN